MASTWTTACFSREKIANGNRRRTNFRVPWSPAGQRRGVAASNFYRPIQFGDELVRCGFVPQLSDATCNFLVPFLLSCGVHGVFQAFETRARQSGRWLPPEEPAPFFEAREPLES